MCVCASTCSAQAHMVNVMNNETHYKVQRIEDKPTAASNGRDQRHREEMNKGLFECSHTWTKRQDVCAAVTLVRYI